MKLTITLDKDVLEKYQRLEDERQDNKKIVDEKIEALKGNKKKLEKDEVYTKAVYNLVVNQIAQSQYREKIIDEVMKVWKEKSVNFKQRNSKVVQEEV